MRADSKGNNSTRPNIGRKNCKYNHSKAGQRACRQQKPTKIVVERHYVGTEKMETVFKRIAEEQITKKVKDMAQSNAS